MSHAHKHTTVKQRFGSGGAPTSEVGFAMMRGDWAAAVKLIMTPREGENPEVARGKVHYLAHTDDPQVRISPVFSITIVMYRVVCSTSLDCIQCISCLHSAV
jgi:tRNA pseudouridine synthase D (TruD)